MRTCLMVLVPCVVFFATSSSDAQGPRNRPDAPAAWGDRGHGFKPWAGSGRYVGPGRYTRYGDRGHFGRYPGPGRYARYGDRGHFGRYPGPGRYARYGDSGRYSRYLGWGGGYGGRIPW